MTCTKCNCKVMRPYPDGYMCSCCGKFFPDEIEVKELEFKTKKVPRHACVSRKQEDSILRCNKFFADFKRYIQKELMKGRGFNEIHRELRKTHSGECPSYGWLRERYLGWANPKRGESNE